MNTGIVGASGYSGELLVRLLLGHPNVKLTCVTSRQHSGKSLDEVMPQLRGRTGGLVFTASDPMAVAALPDVELFFLALPHGVACEYAAPLLEAGKRVIDLSADFRLSSSGLYQEYYGGPHPAPQLLEESAYVLPEITPPGWKDRKLIAAPGCYPTSILLPLLPLVKQGVVDSEGIVISSYSGVSGAGRKVAEDYLFCERVESSKAYGVAKHRHLSEIEEQLSAFAGRPVVVQFTPHLAPMKRGIATTIVARTSATAEDAYAVWNSVYGECPFISVLPQGTTPDTAHVTGTNRIDFSAVKDHRTGNLVITSAEDNLMKGAGGQAIQIMNLWSGFPETAGLQF